MPSRSRSHYADYAARINRVFDHIDAHLTDALDLTTLARVAHLSPWHFHRVFQALTGETLAERVRRRRVEVAAARLVAEPAVTALAVALDVGFASPEVFTRTFRAHFGVTPTAWRRGGFRAWVRRQRVQLSKIRQANRKKYQALVISFAKDTGSWPLGPQPRRGGRSMDVEIKTLPEVKVAYMRHVGPYGSPAITEMWLRFDGWCQARGLMSPRRRMYGLAQDNPMLTAPDKARYDACVEVDAGFRPEGEIGVQTIGAGRYACAKFTGTAPEISGAWMRFLREWLPTSRHQPDHQPALELYDTDFAVDPKTFAFSCLLCLPVRPL